MISAWTPEPIIESAETPEPIIETNSVTNRFRDYRATELGLSPSDLNEFAGDGRMKEIR